MIQPLIPSPPHLLLLMRHAKTELAYGLKRDFDRRLTATGERDARQMGEWLKQQEHRIDWVLASPARRARQTTEIVCEVLGIPTDRIEFRDELYHASSETFFKVIQTVADAHSGILIVSHNNGITEFANQLTNTRIDHLQPGSVFAVTSNETSWAKFKEGKRKFLFYKQ